MRLCGSSDIYQARKKSPAKSVNYIISHDGFTLSDLVSYNIRHNLANLEDNRDGHGNNLSFNCGQEGSSDDPHVLFLRNRLKRALLATMLLSQGTPMLCAGDEMGHTQGGNNNPYCQDNPSTWIDWAHADPDLLAFTQHVIALRKRWQPFANHWYTGVADADGVYDLSWWQPDGSPLQNEAWHQPMTRALACLISKPGKSPQPLLILVNAGASDEIFALPRGQWVALLDTRQPTGQTDLKGKGGNGMEVAAHSLIVLQSTGPHYT
jgi:glycogen operon protein